MDQAINQEEIKMPCISGILLTHPIYHEPSAMDSYPHFIVWKDVHDVKLVLIDKWMVNIGSIAGILTSWSELLLNGTNAPTG